MTKYRHYFPAHLIRPQNLFSTRTLEIILSDKTMSYQLESCRESALLAAVRKNRSSKFARSLAPLGDPLLRAFVLRCNSSIHRSSATFSAVLAVRPVLAAPPLILNAKLSSLHCEFTGSPSLPAFNALPLALYSRLSSLPLSLSFSLALVAKVFDPIIFIVDRDSSIFIQFAYYRWLYRPANYGKVKRLERRGSVGNCLETFRGELRGNGGAFFISS